MTQDQSSSGDSGSAAAPGAEEGRKDYVLYEVVERHIARVTFNRPERRNAILTPDMNDQLEEAMAKAQDDDDIKVVILAGAGKDFCAGEDVRRTPVESYGLKKGQRLPQSYRIRGMHRSIERSRGTLMFSDKVIIAAVQGAALGAGAMQAFYCDLIVAADDAYFARFQGRLGFAGLDLNLPIVLLRLGINRGYEALITGRTMSAQELKDWGVISSVVPRDQLMDEALRYARAVAAHSTDGLMIARQAMHMFWNLMGLSTFNVFAGMAHPLFTNLVWRDDEFNLLKTRNEVGARESLRLMHKRWEDLGFK